MTPSSTPLLRRAVRWSLLIGVALLLVLGSVGAAVDGLTGLVAAALGVLIAVLFMAITAASILLANRFGDGEYATAVFFAVVLGSWLLKFALFIVVLLVLRATHWIDMGLLFAGLLSGIIGSLLVDVLVLSRSKLPYVSDPKLPAQSHDKA